MKKRSSIQNYTCLALPSFKITSISLFSTFQPNFSYFLKLFVQNRPHHQIPHLKYIFSALKSSKNIGISLKNDIIKNSVLTLSKVSLSSSSGQRPAQVASKVRDRVSGGPCSDRLSGGAPRLHSRNRCWPQRKPRLAAHLDPSKDLFRRGALLHILPRTRFSARFKIGLKSS